MAHQRIAYNSCRNRHCPKCQSLARAQWIEHRQAELLNVEYFHVVFTLPEEIAAIAYQNKAVVYNLLFAATAETLRTIAADPKHLGAEIGFFAVLHTWGQNLIHHPHLHCVVPGGGLSADGQRWIAVSPRVLPARAGALALLPPAIPGTARRRPSTAVNSSSSQPCRSCASAMPSDDISILCERRNGSSTPKHPLPDPSRSSITSAAIPIASRSRIIVSSISTTGHVTFRWKDYRDDNAQKTMTLEADEFIRRFLLHVLPQGLQRIRYYGLLGNRHREEKLAQCRQLLQMEPKTPSDTDAEPPDYRDRYQALTGVSLHQCPVCHRGRMLIVEQINRPAQPPITIDTS